MTTTDPATLLDELRAAADELRARDATRVLYARTGQDDDADRLERDLAYAGRALARRVLQLVGPPDDLDAASVLHRGASERLELDVLRRLTATIRSVHPTAAALRVGSIDGRLQVTDVLGPADELLAADLDETDDSPFAQEADDDLNRLADLDGAYRHRELLLLAHSDGTD